MPHRIDVKIFKNATALRHNSTDAEIKLWHELRLHQMDGVHFRRQHAIGYYIVDFCAPRLKFIIELDGGQHVDQKEYDRKRTVYLQSKGYKVLRFWDHEVLEDLNVVMQTIFESLKNGR